QNRRLTRGTSRDTPPLKAPESRPKCRPSTKGRRKFFMDVLVLVLMLLVVVFVWLVVVGDACGWACVSAWEVVGVLEEACWGGLVVVVAVGLEGLGWKIFVWVG
ncbi:MAG: hypothetical protein ACTSUQ_08095, partial [Candidatus Freyarchaeota archaeon]